MLRTMGKFNKQDSKTNSKTYFLELLLAPNKKNISIEPIASLDTEVLATYRLGRSNQMCL